MTRLGRTILAVALLAGCDASRALTPAQPCPCTQGWSCDTATNTCVASSNDAGTVPPPGSCACDTTISTTGLQQRYVTVSRDCFCASPDGFLCHDFDEAGALCSRADIKQVSAARFAGCTLKFLHVTVGSTAVGRPSYATLRFDGNSFAGASYEADLVCNNLPADEVNDMYLGVTTDHYYDNLDPACGSVEEWNPCSSDAGTNAD